MLGNLYERNFEYDKAEKEFLKAIDKLPKDQNTIDNVGRTFSGIAKYELAIQAYEKGSKLLNNNTVFAKSLSALYQKTGDREKMISYALKHFENPVLNLEYEKSDLKKKLEDDDFRELQAQLYTIIQEQPEQPNYVDLLSWSFIQSKDYDKALRQNKALDRRLDENGFRVYDLAKIALADKDYETAISAFNYLIEEKGLNSSYYLEAKSGILKTKTLIILDNPNSTEIDFLPIEQEYEAFLAEYGKNRQTAGIMNEFAEFETYQMQNYEKALAILKEMVQYGGVKPEIQALAKLNLGDIYLMNEDRWEATLLYAQVDKDFKEGELGEKARYKNALLSYFMGDFEWAQEQFDILKSATTKLISNDAIDKSVFIMDNLGLDTTDVPLILYSNAELLVFQNRYDEAFTKMDSINLLFPEHGLEDDVFYLKAQIFQKQKKYQEAITMYEAILEKYTEEIRADNALFEMAQIYDYILDDKAKAQSLYEKLFIDFSNSSFAVEARKRFRTLRGDNI
jgi:tetratricopeptide (TPR) repeat protein